MLSYAQFGILADVPVFLRDSDTVTASPGHTARVLSLGQAALGSYQLPPPFHVQDSILMAAVPANVSTNRRHPLVCFYPDGSTGNLPNLTWLAGGRRVTDSWFQRDEIAFWLLCCPFCFVFAAWCCASCRFPGRWPVSSWSSAVMVHHLASGTQLFCHWQKQFATFFSQPRVHPCQSQQAVFLKLRKSPYLKQFLKLVFLNLVYFLFSAVSATVLCSWGQSWGDSSSWKPIAPAAWVMLAQKFTVFRQSLHQLPITLSGTLGMSLMVQKPVGQWQSQVLESAIPKDLGTGKEKCWDFGPSLWKGVI